MTTNTISSRGGTDPDDPSSTILFDAFADPRRQRVLHYLSHKATAVPLGDLAEYIALSEETPTRDYYERILVSLVHVHLPRLAAAGLVCYDAEQETVALRMDRGTLQPYLELAVLSPLE